MSSTYTVEGMTCEHCVASVTEEVSELDGVTDVTVELSSGRLTVDGDVNTEAVRDAVTVAGYTLVD